MCIISSWRMDTSGLNSMISGCRTINQEVRVENYARTKIWPEISARSTLLANSAIMGTLTVQHW